MLSPRLLVLTLALAALPAVARPQTVPVTLAWDYAQPGMVTSFAVLRRVEDASWTVVAEGLPALLVSVWSDPETFPGATVCYRVRALLEATPDAASSVSPDASLICAPDQVDLCVTPTAVP